jgi:hypothetical protein
MARASGPGKYLLVITACIDPSGGPARVVRADPAVRLEDYRAALRYWLAHPDRRLRDILFLENSGYSLDALREIARSENPLNKQVEFVSMRCNNFPEKTGHGYAELQMLDEGLPQSKLAAVAKYLIKVTGRLTFPDLPRLLDRLPDEYLFAVDSRNSVKFTRVPQVFVTTQLMIFSAEFYRTELAGIREQMLSRNILCIENLFWDKLIPYRGRNGAILRWPVNVDPVGIAAHWEFDYRSGRKRLLSAARAVARVVTPWWWV